MEHSFYRRALLLFAITCGLIIFLVNLTQTKNKFTHVMTQLLMGIHGVGYEKEPSINGTPISLIPPVLFPHKKLVIWSNEWHCAPIYDTDLFLRPFGVNVLDKNISPNC